MDVCKVTEIYQNEARNKPAISMTVRRAHFEDENKAPDWPGQDTDYACSVGRLVVKCMFRIMDH